jgi:hypothetical protein
MSDMFKILAKLSENRVSYCLQNQGKNNFYNLAVDDPKGKRHNIHSDKLEDIENGLKIFWGHLLTAQVMSFPRP